MECWEPTPRWGATFHSASLSSHPNPDPSRTIQKIAKLCPHLKRLKILAKDVSFRQLEQLNNIEEVNPLIWMFYPTPPSWRLTSRGVCPPRASRCAWPRQAGAGASPVWTSHVWTITPGSPLSTLVKRWENAAFSEKFQSLNFRPHLSLFDKVSFDTLERGHDRCVLAWSSW